MVSLLQQRLKARNVNGKRGKVLKRYWKLKVAHIMESEEKVSSGMKVETREYIDKQSIHRWLMSSAGNKSAWTMMVGQLLTPRWQSPWPCRVLSAVLHSSLQGGRGKNWRPKKERAQSSSVARASGTCQECRKWACRQAANCWRPRFCSLPFFLSLTSITSERR